MTLENFQGKYIFPSSSLLLLSHFKSSHLSRLSRVRVLIKLMISLLVSSYSLLDKKNIFFSSFDDIDDNRKKKSDS